VALSHNTLENYYNTIFAMIQHHKYSVTEIENLLPFERDIYVTMLAKFIKETEEAKQNAKQ
jgi:hypothetical protein